MKEINIIQFSPYYPPHIGGVEKVVQEIHKNWEYGKSIVFTSDIWRDIHQSDEAIIYYPAVECITNFPFPKFWKKDFWEALSKLNNLCNTQTRIITHTRFFFSSFLWVIFAKYNRLRNTHIEHGSGFVKSGKWIVDSCSKIYDIIFWKWCIKSAYNVFGISQASMSFLKKDFWRTDASLWYRGVHIVQSDAIASWDICFVYIGRLSLLKRVDDLVETYKNWNFTQKLYVIGTWDSEKYLKEKARGCNIEFLWEMKHELIIEFLQRNRCILINPSSQEWLPTTVIEWLLTNNVVIATDVWWTSEITGKEDLLLYTSWNIQELSKYMKAAIDNYGSFQWKSYDSVREKFWMKQNIEKLYNFMK